MSEEALRVLLAEDDASLRESLADYLCGQYGYHVDAAADGEDTWERVLRAEQPYDVALIDDLLVPKPGSEPEPIGIDLLHRIKDRCPETEVIIFTGWGMDCALEALRAGAYRYLAKPLNLDELGMTIRMAAERRQLKRQLETTKQEKEWLQTFLEIGRATTSVLELDEVLELVHEQVGRLMDASCLDVILYDESSQTLHFELGYDRGEREAKWKRPFTRGQGLTDWVIEQCQPLLIKDCLHKVLPVPAYQRGDASRSWLGVPLVARGRVVGAITVQSYESHQFDETHQQILTAIASQVASAIEHARLFYELTETKERLDALVASSFDAVIAIDRDGKITVFNQRAEEMLGWTAPEMIGQTVARLHTDVEKAREIFDAVNRDGAIFEWDVELKHRDGPTIPILLSAALVRDSRGRIIGQAGFMRDLRRVSLLEERLRALMEVTQIVTGELALNEVLDLIMKSAVAAFPAAQWGSIHLYDERAGVLRPQAHLYHLSPEAVEARTFRIGEGIAGWVYEHRTPLVVDDVQQDPHYKRVGYSEVPRHRSITCVPLQVRGQVIGTLSLDKTDTPGTFQVEDLGLLRSFADQAAIAIDNARRVQKLEHIRQAAEAMARAFEPRRALEQIVESASEVLRADSSAIWSYDGIHDKFVPEELVAVGIPHDELERFSREEIKPGRTADVVMRRGYVAVTDISQPEYDFLGQPTQDLLNRIGVRSFQGIVLGVGDERLGVLYVNYNRTQTFDEDKDATLRMFASHAALALKNARLLEQVSSARDMAKVVAEVSVLEDLKQTLHSIVEGTQDVLGCDAVSLYTYDQTTDKLGYPPSMTGVWYPDRVTRLPEVLSDSIVFKMLRRDEPYIVHSTFADSLFRDLRFVVDEHVQSCAAMPLQVKNRRVGVMFVNYRSRHRFTSEELTNIELFAYQAAVAIRNAQLYEETVRRASALQALYEAGTAVTSTLALDEILNRIVEQAWRFTGHRGERPHFSHLALKEGNVLKFGAAYPPEHLPGLQSKVGCIDLECDECIGVTGRAAKTGQVQLVGDVMQNPDYIAYVPQVRSELAVPIKLGEEVIGVINVEHPGYNAFDEDDQRDLESLATQAAIAIQNARLYQQATERLSESRALQQVATSLAGTFGLEEVLHVVMRAAMELTDTDSGSIMFWDSQLERFTRALTTVGPDRTLQSYRSRVQPEGGIARTIIDELKPIVIPDTQYDSRVSPIAPDKGCRALIGVPLVSRRKAIGVLYVSSSEPRQFSEGQVTLLESLASQAAVVIERARQYEELKRTKGLVGARTALAWMGMTSSAWRHAIDKHALTIREQSQLLGRDLQSSLSDEDYAKVDGRLGMVEHLTTQILEKPIVPPLSAEERGARVVVNDLIDERARQLWQNEPYKSIELELDLSLDKTATVRASPEWLRRAFDVLVDNAVDAVANCDVRRVTVGTREADGGAETIVSDTGPGIPEAMLPRLGWEPIEKLEGAKGLGMGLLMAQTIVQTYGGEIRVGSTGPAGTTMVIWLPREK